MTAPLTLNRVEDMITGPMRYGVQRHHEDGRSCLLGTWDSFPFIIEEPESHEGWLLVAGEWEAPLDACRREELASSVNDWNRDCAFPTVCLVDTGTGPLLRAVYLVDLCAGVTDPQLRLHLDTGLTSCTRALSQIRPLLPEL